MNIEEKNKNLMNWVKWIGFLAIGFVVSPFIFLSIKGLIGLAVAAMVGFTVIQFIPVFAQMIANLKYRVLDAEKVRHIKGVVGAASENPIETLQTLLIAKKKAFSEFVTSVENAVSARATFKSKVEKFKQRYPERAQEFEKQLERVTDLVERKKKALQEAQQSLNDGDMKLEEMKAYYEMSKDAIEANRAAGMDTGDAFEKLKMDTACDSVFETMNTAFAQLEIAATLDVESETDGSKNVKNTPVSKTLNEVILETEQRKARA